VTDLEALLHALIRPGLTLAVVAAVIAGATWALRRASKGHSERALVRQGILLLLYTFGAIALLVSLPMSDSLRGQLLGLAGIVMSASLALSSTTFLGNAIAGIMLRSVKSFRLGDFIEVGDHIGRVTGRGLFHVEIQSEDRNLTTLPNLFVATNPAKVTPAAGALASAEVSLGYDVPRAEIEAALLDAAAAVGLSEAFVLVVSLGDFSVVYRVSGLLGDSGRLVSTRSALRAAMMDALHARRVEIVSPSFMNQRQVGDQVFIPVASLAPAVTAPVGPAPEDVMFDKADRAAAVGRLEADVAAREAALEGLREEEGAEERVAAEEREIASLREQVSAAKQALIDSDVTPPGA
jgi:small-conductance mechanosensitive channel